MTRIHEVPARMACFEIRGLAEGEWYVEAFVEDGDAITDGESLGRHRAGAKDVELRLPK